MPVMKRQLQCCRKTVYWLGVGPVTFESKRALATVDRAAAVEFTGSSDTGSSVGAITGLDDVVELIPYPASPRIFGICRASKSKYIYIFWIKISDSSVIKRL